MAQFTVYKNKNAQTKSAFPLLVDIQSELLDDLATRAVIPLTESPDIVRKPLSRLTPPLKVEGKTYLLMTYHLASIPKNALGAPVSDASEDRGKIIAALDFLITGI